MSLDFDVFAVDPKPIPSAVPGFEQASLVDIARSIKQTLKISVQLSDFAGARNFLAARVGGQEILQFCAHFDL